MNCVVCLKLWSFLVDQIYRLKISIIIALIYIGKEIQIHRLTISIIIFLSSMLVNLIFVIVFMVNLIILHNCMVAMHAI